MKKLVSIIVPIYKVEKFLNRCIRSLVNQTYQNLEIILVDDGSPDRCPQMCEEWAARDRRIRVIHKKNGGLGYARNTGMDHATGDYLLFVDSDDYIALETIEKIMKVADQTGAELIQFGSISLDANGAARSQRVPRTKKEVYRGEEVRDIILPNMIVSDLHGGELQLAFNACSNAYSHKLIQRSGWRFVSERELISEDYYSVLCLMKDVQSFATIPETFYYYCMNGNSLTHIYRPDRFAQQKKFYIACLKKCEEACYSQEVKERFAHLYMNGIINILHLYCVSNMSRRDKKQMIKEIICDSDLQKTVHCMDIGREPFKKHFLYFVIRQKWVCVVHVLFWARYGWHR